MHINEVPEPTFGTFLQKRFWVHFLYSCTNSVLRTQYFFVLRTLEIFCTNRVQNFVLIEYKRIIEHERTRTRKNPKLSNTNEHEH